MAHMPRATPRGRLPCAESRKEFRVSGDFLGARDLPNTDSVDIALSFLWTMTFYLLWPLKNSILYIYIHTWHYAQHNMYSVICHFVTEILHTLNPKPQSRHPKCQTLSPTHK